MMDNMMLLLLVLPLGAFSYSYDYLGRPFVDVNCTTDHEAQTHNISIFWKVDPPVNLHLTPEQISYRLADAGANIVCNSTNRTLANGYNRTSDDISDKHQLSYNISTNYQYYESCEVLVFYDDFDDPFQNFSITTTVVECQLEVPSVVLSNPPNISIGNNVTFSLSFEYYAVPPPTFTWYINDEFYETVDNTTSHGTHIMVFTNAIQGGWHQCVVENRFGIDNYTVFVIIKALPPPPSPSSSSSLSSSSVAILISAAAVTLIVAIISLIIIWYLQVGRFHLKKNGSYNKKYPLDTGIIETVNKECKDPTTDSIPLIHLESDVTKISDQPLESQSSFSELSQSPIIYPQLHETSASTTMILTDDFQKPTRPYQQLTHDVYDVSLPADEGFQPTVKPKIVLYSSEDNFSPYASTGSAHFTLYKVLEDCPLPNKEIVTEVFDSKGGNIKIKKHDVLIHIPENAIAANDLVEVKACGNLVGPYRLPEHYERVSAFVWVSATYKFQKNIQMYLQHFCVVDNEDDIKDLCLLTANESDKILEDGGYVYMMHEDEIEYYFEAGCDECYILTKSWCTKCIVKRRKLKSSHCLSFGYLSRPISVGKNVQISFEICFCYSLSECIQTIQEQHKECILLKKAPMPFVLVKNHYICLNYPKQCSGWEVEHTGKTKIAPEDIHFQRYKHHDLEALEKINAYPPRFHLTFYNYDSMQHLSIVIKVELEKSKHKKKNKDENKILSFFINTPDYAEFTHSTTVSPLDQSEPQQVNDRSPMWKEYSVFMKYFAALTHTLTDIDNLLPHFISNGIITIEDTDEVKSKPRQSDQLRQLLKHIEGPLRVNDARNVYILLDVMSTHGSISTKRLAATMRGELQSQSDHQPQQMQVIPDGKEQDTTTANPIDGSLCSEDGDNKAIILDGEYEETTDL